MSELIKVACQALIREADTRSSDARRKHDARIAVSQRQRDVQAAGLAYHRNSLAPVNKLPFEMLSHIFLLVSLDAWNGYDHTRLVGRMATVGKHWLRVAFSTPQLWSTLSEEMSPGQVRLAIERSRTSPLHIHFYPRDSLGYHRAMRRETFLELVTPHIQRWRALKGRVPTDVLGRIEFNGSSLQVLRLESSFKAQAGPRFADGAHLQHLELTSIGTRWTSTGLHGLKHLELSNLNWSQAPSLVELFHILAHSPQLEVFLLYDVMFTDTTLSDPESPPPFLRLRRLQLTSISSRSYNCILSRLRFPNCRSIDLAPHPPATVADSNQYRHYTPFFAEQIRSALSGGDNEPFRVVIGRGAGNQSSLTTFKER
ncbi:hypothetical protein FRB94_001861 [Tulasnella sp. JGI-2019a]|nr:hypothetical protein FRB94_001861 [Tulasnella sp. JGI-2019a]KAG9017272.1 hypothetical protein FRB93_007385 [Tulasnella sp. JGI-2019a]